MDSIDDDFGDLYVDVEAQATFAVAGGAQFGRSLGESECGTDLDRIRSSKTTINPGSEAGAKKLGPVTQQSSRCVDGGGVTPAEESNEAEESDSVNDLNIVLMDGNSENGGYNNAAADGVEASDNGSVRRPETGNWCVMPDSAKISGGVKMEASATDARMNRARGMPQCGYGFSLPRCRIMFGMSINLFEEKPWRNPGADITDFFNFGFNEHSWEDYCKSLRQHYAFGYEQVKGVDYDVEDKTQVQPLARSIDGGPRPLVLGRAIEVEDRTLERIPFADLRRPRDPDPEVVIQIPVDNSVGELSGLTIEEPGCLTTEEPGASGNMDDDKWMHSSVDSTEEHASVEFQEGNTRISSGEQSSLKENCCSSEGTPCAKEVINEVGKEVCVNSDESDPYPVEREPSPSDQIHFSLTPSYSLGKSEESESLKDSATDDRLEVNTPPRQTRLSECDPSEYKVHERNCIKAGEGNETVHFRCSRSHEKNGTKRVRPRRSHEDPRKRHCGRSDYAIHRRIKLENVKDALPISDSDSDSGREILARRRRSFCYSSKYRNNVSLFNSERDDNDGKGFHVSDRERHYSRMYASMDRAKHRNRQHKYSYHNNIESLHPRGLEHSNGYDYERESGDYAAHSPFNYPRRKSLWSFKKEEDPYSQHHYERGYFQEKNALLDEENIRDRNRYDSQTEPFYAEKVPLTDEDHWCSLEYTSDNRRHNHKWSQENDLHYRNRYRYQYEDEVHREIYELAYHERHSYVKPGRRKYPEYERDGEFSGRGEIYDYAPDWRLGGFASQKAGYNYKRTDAKRSSSLSLRESRNAKGARSDFWRDNIREFKVTKSYDGLKNQLYKAGERDGRMGKLRDSVDTEDRLNNGDDWIHPDRRRYKLKNDIRDTVTDVAHHEHPSNTVEMSVRDRRTSTCDQMSTKQRTSHDKSHIYGRDTGCYRSKKKIEEHNLSASTRTKHEHALPKFQPVDLTVRQGKYSMQSGRRCSNDKDTRGSLNRDEPRTLGTKSSENPVQLQDSDMKEEGEIVEEARKIKESEIDEERIRESLRKMEKRRERFKEAEIVKMKTVGTGEYQAAEVRAETSETKQQRPTRKRLWCAA